VRRLAVVFEACAGFRNGLGSTLCSRAVEARIFGGEAS
jgi:hypothetical protein